MCYNYCVGFNMVMDYCEVSLKMKSKTDKWFDRNAWWVIVATLLIMYGGLIGVLIWIG